MRSVLFGLLIANLAHAATFSDCIIENMKGVNSDLAARLVQQACQEKALPHIPAKCKPTGEKNVFDQFDPPSQTCIDTCLNASYWSKHFGDCAP